MRRTDDGRVGAAEGDVDEEAERAAVGGAEVEEEVVEEAAEGAVVRVKVHQHRNRSLTILIS